MLSTDSNKNCSVYSKSNSSITMIGNDTNKIIQELFDSFLRKYQIHLEQSMKGSNFILDYVSGMHCICDNISLRHGVSYIDSRKQIKNKKVTIKKKNDKKFFQYAVTAALNHEQTKRYPV